jgi:hypothetical protein
MFHGLRGNYRTHRALTALIGRLGFEQGFSHERTVIYGRSVGQPSGKGATIERRG